MKIRIKIGLIIITVFALVLSTAPTSAMTSEQLRFYGKNNIFIYNPDGVSDNCIIGSNTNYTGEQVATGGQMDTISANQPFYEAAAAKYGFDWHIIAAIHYREYGLKRSNPSNGQGVYQLYSYTRIPGTNKLDPAKAFLPAGAISDEEFQRQTDIVAGIIADMANEVGANLSTADGVKRLFFRFNGMSQKYIDRALAMGFTMEQARNGEGSTYVMNIADERRDPNSPNVDKNWIGTFSADGTWSSGTKDQRYGAYPYYISIGGNTALSASFVNTGPVSSVNNGNSSSSTVCYTVGSGGGRLVAGATGMTLSEAEAFMEQYKLAIRNKSNSELMSLYGFTKNNCSGGLGYNCVSFSKYFINTYTEYASNHITGSIGDGKDVAGKLISERGFINGGSTPKVYAIFSGPGTTSAGHTGVVLGINTDTNKIIIGEAACTHGKTTAQAEAGIKAREESLSEYMTSAYRYAYPKTVNGVY